MWFYAQKSKRPHASHEPKSLRDVQGLVPTHASLQPFWKSPCVSSTRHIVYSGNMSTQKTLCNVFQPSRTKPTHTLSIGQGKKTDVDPCEISGPKESVFKFKWLYEFSWLMYIFTNNHMKCKTCLDAYGCSAKPSQSYVQGATNFQRSALDHHQLGNKSLSQPL